MCVWMAELNALGSTPDKNKIWYWLFIISITLLIVWRSHAMDRSVSKYNQLYWYSMHLLYSSSGYYPALTSAISNLLPAHWRVVEILLPFGIAWPRSFPFDPVLTPATYEVCVSSVGVNNAWTWMTKWRFELYCHSGPILTSKPK